jgi:flagellar biosynthesis/type III secretory pathway chaperone
LGFKFFRCHGMNLHNGLILYRSLEATEDAAFIGTLRSKHVV